jgi:hypothetical protein
MKEQVNYWTIYSAIAVLEQAESMHGELGIDPDDTNSVRNALAAIVAPHVQKWSPFWRNKLRLSLAYYIRRPDILNYKVLANLQDFSMAEPSDVRGFFSVLWDVLFPGENLKAVSLDDVVENNDIMEGVKGGISCIDRTKDRPSNDVVTE